MHGMALDRHVMAWHGRIAAHRARRGAARRHPSEFPWNDYGPAGEKNPTPPNRKSVLGFREKKKFSIRKSGGHFQLGGSDFLHMQGHSLCCEIQGILLYQFEYTVGPGPFRIAIFSTQYDIPFGGHSAKHSFFTINFVLDVP